MRRTPSSSRDTFPVNGIHLIFVFALDMVSIYESLSFFMFNIMPSQVHGASCHRLPWGNPSIWLHFHWNVSHAVCDVSHAVGMWYGELCSRWHLPSYFSSGTLSSHLFGPTKFTMCTASWCWSWSSYASWPCVSPLCAHTSCSTLRTTDGECCNEIKCLSAEKHMAWELHDFAFSIPGNGQASFLLHLLLFMFTCTPFTTTSLKLSKLQISSSSYEKIISLSGLKMHYNT